MFDLLTDALQVLAQLGDAAAAGAATAGAAAADAATAVPPAAASAAGVVTGAAAAKTAAVAADAGGMLHFISQSDLVGKSLFGFLIAMSLTSWYLIFVKAFTNMRIRRRSNKFLHEFWAASSLEQVEQEIATHGATEPFAHLTSHAIHAGKHHAKYGAIKLEEKGSTGAFVTRTIRKVIDEETARLENGLTVLASIGSTAPFVGLFGTVWGVYHALVGIGLSDGVTINRIAGPVGESLIMTGLGLAVAIPAVLAYNGFVRGNRVYLARLDAFAHDLFTFLSTGQQVSETPVRTRRVKLATGKEN
jgi:biopolymer transport protein ExbB